MALGSHLITVRRLEKYINDVIGKKANLPDTSKTIIGNISQINSDLTNNTCTNLLNPTAQTQTKNGVTFTNNGDGTYTVNGTASTITWYPLTYQLTDLDLSRKYKMVGCPQGGSENSYSLKDGENATFDTGNGVIYTPTKQTTFHIRIGGGTTCNNLLFKPMLTTDLNAKYSDYVPYTGDSGRLNEDVAEIYDNVTELNSNKQNKTDNALTTTAKTIVGAINELLGKFANYFTKSEINTKLTWKFYSDRIGGQASDLPSEWNELQVVIFNSQQPYLYYTFNYNRTSWAQGTVHENKGYYRTATDYQVCTLELKPNSIRLERLFTSGTEYATAGQTHQHIYYR